MITHLHAHADGGRVVEYADGTIACGFPSEQGGRGYIAVTSDGRGAWALRPTLREAKIAVCDELGLDKRYIIGSGADDDG